MFCTAWEKVPETVCFLFSTWHLDVGRCVDTPTGGTDAWQKHLLLSKPVRLRREVCQSLSTSGMKFFKKENQTRRCDGMDASQIMHFLSFLV